jgi:hypothetical protein
MTYKELVSELLAHLPQTEEQAAIADIETLRSAAGALYELKELIDLEIDRRHTYESMREAADAWLIRTGQK